MTKGYLLLLLHAHLPFIRHPEYPDFLEEDWLFEAITETYVPLIDMMDRLIRDGREEFDRARRGGLYRRLHALIDEAQPYTFLYSSPSLVALHRRFENVRVYPIGMDPLEWKVNSRFAMEAAAP